MPHKHLGKLLAAKYGMWNGFEFLSLSACHFVLQTTKGLKELGPRDRRYMLYLEDWGLKPFLKKTKVHQTQPDPRAVGTPMLGKITTKTQTKHNCVSRYLTFKASRPVLLTRANPYLGIQNVTSQKSHFLKVYSLIDILAFDS